MSIELKKDHKKLGELLLDAGKITKEQLDTALSEQKKNSERLGKILVMMNILTEEELIKFLAQQLKVKVIEINNIIIDENVARSVPEEVLRKYQILPFAKKFNVLSLAMVDPLNVEAIDEVIRITRYEIEPVMCAKTELKQVIDRLFGTTTIVERAIEDIKEGDFLEFIEEKFESEENVLEVNKLRDIAEDTPIIRFVNNLLILAIRENASDIHIEPEDKRLMIRLRIDGVLQEIPSPPKKMQLPIISRIKIMSKMDIAKMRVPQDGRFDVKLEGKDVGFRVSTFPTNFGENVVLRVLDKSSSNYALEDLGLLKEDQERLTSIIKKHYGFILATGPTGSGKTTMLYALLKIINTMDKNIITIEDPIEYTIQLVRQSQINPKAGLTFSSGLRSILRQDPDIIMVGEIRDKETSVIAIQSALTGHLVLSTLHTNDAPSAITRLIDMGNEPYLVASSITAVIAQRLVRRICPKCKESFTPSEKFLRELGVINTIDILLYKGKGCEYCKKTGYKGRTGIFEILFIDDDIKELTVRKAPSDQILKTAQKSGMHTMKEDAIIKALNGTIDLNEALSIIKMD